MTAIAPFRAVRYDPSAVGDLSAVTAPPYDVISPEARDSFEAASPYNIVRVDLGREEPSDDDSSNKYTRARGLLEAWIAGGVLRRDERPTLTVYEQRFSLDGQAKVVRGVLAAVALEEPGAGGVLPHERTMRGPVQDRLALMRATGTNLSPIFAVYAGEEGAARAAIRDATAEAPLARFAAEDGVEHVVWTIEDPEAIRAVAEGIGKASVVIADGHHRYRTAEEFRDERRATGGPGPWDATLMYLVDAESDGPALLPIHRVVSGVEATAALERLRTVYRVEEAAGADLDALARELAARRARGRAFVVSDGARAWWLGGADPAVEREALPSERSAVWRDMDVAVLHGLIFERLLGGVAPGFVHSPGEARQSIERGEASLAFLLAPMPFETVLAVAEAGEAMPPKSTYFHPKPRTGVVVRTLD